ncbi:LOW QUALITY PROTEIN: hypothetical protein GQ55_5G092400 [Panicum hallii var. hallii]|uniref:Bowman-Birk serine protease inhibitors family domain-containing protein n=1 Tax=Panicum hallii var. hallii TaxID=1504633 RepID=A0A2T7DEE6_9POAL|nr:LOW QUALITY PROTEIN: hypothetical protein GQ55_5G092400 [Panicum hallii var. hallii]
MKTQVLLLAVAVLAVLAALPLAETKRAEAPKASAWPCCDTCGACTRSLPPQCLCADEAPGGCHPACRNCVKSTVDGGSDVFRCADRITNFCKHGCTPAA